MADDYIELTDEEPGRRFPSQGQMIALGVLGVLGVLAVVLTVAARRAGRTPSAGFVSPEGSEPWQVSLRHFAGATDYRFRGMEERLDELAVLLGQTPPPPPAPVDRTQGSANLSVAMPAPTGPTEPPPPSPAATSLPADGSVGP